MTNRMRNGEHDCDRIRLLRRIQMFAHEDSAKDFRLCYGKRR